MSDTNSSFYGDTPNYATTYPTQNDSNSEPVNGNSPAPSSFYPNGGTFQEADPDAAAASASQAAASAAAALASQNAAGNSATSASASAATATAQAAIATTGANTATTQATNAANSATAAATSATNAASAVQAAAGTATPLVDGTAAVGTSTKWAHEDHRHQADTATADARIANAAGTATPVVNGTAAVGTSTKWAHEDHVHPTDTSRAPLASPTFTGTPASPTATAGTNTTQIATTAFVAASFAPLASPTFTGTPAGPTAANGTNTTQLATTAFVLANGGSGAMFSVLKQDPTIDNTGIAAAASKLQAAITAISSAGNIAYIPQGVYNCGSSQIAVSDYTIVELHPNAILRRTADPASAQSAYGSYTGALVSLGNHCVWRGGVLDNNIVTAQSTTSLAVGTGSKTFTVSAGLPFSTNDFIRIQSRGNKANHMEGSVTSYSGTSLVVNITFAAGSATAADWNMNYANVYQCPMVLHNVTETVVEQVRVTGNWYVGLLMDGWNPSTGGSNNTQFCTFRNCWVEGVQNRAIYFYGTVSDSSAQGCFIDGSSGTTDYGVNVNPANATGSVNNCLRLKITGVSIINTGFQGVEIGDASLYCVVSECSASGLTQVSSAAFLVQQANTGIAQYNTVSNCIASGCAGIGFEVAGAYYTDFIGCAATTCYRGFMFTSQGGQAPTYCTARACRVVASQFAGIYITGSAIDATLEGVTSIANSGAGIAIDTGCTNTIVSGRSTGNTGANFSNSGTGTVSTNLIVV